MTTKDFKGTVLPLCGRIYPMAMRMLGNEVDAEDAVQDIMAKLWDKRKKLEQHPNIAGFVILTARNHCLDCLKKRKPKLDSSEVLLKSLKANTLQNGLELKELTNIIYALLDTLPDQQREVMMMRDLDGLEFAEIASALQLKIEHVRVLLSRARKQVSVKLKKQYSYE